MPSITPVMFAVKSAKPGTPGEEDLSPQALALKDSYGSLDKLTIQLTLKAPDGIDAKS